MSSAIKSIDSSRLITLGDDTLSMGAADLLCTLEDGLDYYSLHPQPPNAERMTLEQLKSFWSGRMEALPQDGAPVVIEEIYPFPQCPGNGAWLGPAGVSEQQLVEAYVN